MIHLEIIEKAYNWSGPLTRRAATDYIVLHHRAGSGDVESLHKLHLQEGYAGIGYHFYIRKDGTIYRGRPSQMLGAHCLGSNAKSIGICFEGNYTQDIMPKAQITAGQELIHSLKTAYPEAEVKKHSDLYPTTCPGKQFPFEEVIRMTIKEAIHIVKTKAGLEDGTIQFLLCYKYGEDLIIKLAQAIAGK